MVPAPECLELTNLQTLRQHEAAADTTDESRSSFDFLDSSTLPIMIASLVSVATCLYEATLAGSNRCD